MRLKADFHIHSCLSPCGSLEMAPAAMARAAKAAGLQAIALTDHNSALNIPAFAEACRQTGLHALFGLEVCTAEELHVLCLFDQTGPALAFGEALYRHLPFFKNQPEKMGDQVVVDIHENILSEEEKYLGMACEWSLSTLCQIVRDRGGWFIPAHVNRRSFSLKSQLGMTPDLPYDALEVMPGYETDPIMESAARQVPLIMSSDAHYLKEIGRRAIELDVERFDLAHLRKALPQARLLALR